MRIALTLAGLCLLLVCAACGKDAGFEFVSEAKEPTGEPVRIAYQLREGEGVRIHLSMVGSTKVSTKKSPRDESTDVTMVMECVCREVRENGDMVLAVRFPEMSRVVDLRRVKVPMVTVIEMTRVLTREGVAGEFEANYTGRFPKSLKRVVDLPGFAQIVALPAEGLRVGEAVDLAGLLPPAAIDEILDAPGISRAKSLETAGEMVLLGTTSKGDEPVAEWKTNLVIHAKGAVPLAGIPGSCDVGMKIQGTQFNSLRTGLPAGEGKLTVAVRGYLSRGGGRAEFDVNLALTYRCEPIRKD